MCVVEILSIVFLSTLLGKLGWNTLENTSNRIDSGMDFPVKFWSWKYIKKHQLLGKVQKNHHLQKSMANNVYAHRYVRLPKTRVLERVHVCGCVLCGTTENLIHFLRNQLLLQIQTKNLFSLQINTIYENMKCLLRYITVAAALFSLSLLLSFTLCIALSLKNDYWNLNGTEMLEGWDYVLLFWFFSLSLSFSRLSFCYLAK